jgi:hypothetical protein
MRGCFQRLDARLVEHRRGWQGDNTPSLTDPSPKGRFSDEDVPIAAYGNRPKTTKTFFLNWRANE